MKKITFLITLLLFTTSLFANNDFLKSLENNNPKLTETVLIFHKPDCPYCEQMGKLISSDIYLQQKTKEKFNVTIVDISTEEGKKIAQLYAVKAVPTMIKYSKGIQSFSILKGFGSNARFLNFLGLELRDESVSVINKGIPPLCGNGTIEGGEQCDDGNLNNGDGCSSVCQIEGAVCGDGNVAPTEQCDDANTTNGDGCNAICSVESGFSCTGSPSVCSAGVCGDGIVAPTEQCDDGNTTNGDGCNAICSVESGFSCTGSPSVCSVLGLEDVNNQFVLLKAYPNPFSNVINMAVFLKDASEVEISLIDNLGKLIKTVKKSNMTFGENEISILIDDALQDGLYFMKIQVTNSNGVFYDTQKLIKE